MTDGGERRREDHAKGDAHHDHTQRPAEYLRPARVQLLSAASVLLLEADGVADGALADQQEEQRARCSPGEAGEHPPADKAAQHGVSSPMNQ